MNSQDKLASSDIFQLPRDEQTLDTSLEQLRHLAMLYHAKGRVKEAQEIYELILKLKGRTADNGD